MKYQIVCNTTEGTKTVLIDERSPVTAALSAIEVLADEHFRMPLTETVKVYRHEPLQASAQPSEEVALEGEERGQVNWLTNALLRRDRSRQFTVAGIYEGTCERYGTDVWARDQHEAMLLAVKQCDSDNDGAGDPMSVLAILDGHVPLLDCAYGPGDYADQHHGKPSEYRASSQALAPPAADRAQDELNVYTVFASNGAHIVRAPDAMAAEHKVFAHRIAAVVAGDVHNLMVDIKVWVYRWAYDFEKEAYKRYATLE